VDVKYLGVSVFVVAPVISVIYLDVKYLVLSIFVVAPVISVIYLEFKFFRCVNICSWFGNIP
jgi:hypothetical protein